MVKPISVNIKKSTRPEKKYVAVFILDNNKTKTIHFGSSLHDDYTIHKDPERKKRYINRHKKNENWNNPMTAGALSRYVLWEKTTLKSSIEYFKKKFKLR